MTDSNNIAAKGRPIKGNDHPPDRIHAFLKLEVQKHRIRTKHHVWFGHQAEWRVLCSLALASVENRSTDITTIVADLAMPRFTVKRVLDLLTVHGDVRLERSSDDRRRVMVIPSEQSMRAFFATLNELITATQALAAEFQK